MSRNSFHFEFFLTYTHTKNDASKFVLFYNIIEFVLLYEVIALIKRRLLAQ